MNPNSLQELREEMMGNLRELLKDFRLVKEDGSSLSINFALAEFSSSHDRLLRKVVEMVEEKAWINKKDRPIWEEMASLLQSSLNDAKGLQE